jgi:putative membrane protein
MSIGNTSGHDSKARRTTVMWGYGMWWSSLIWLILIAALVWTLVTTNRPGRSNRAGALEILEERLARGEIDAETYRTTRTELERN